MAIESDIRDHAYQFFIQEAPELLQLIEEELLTLRQDRSIAKIHNMMRAAHSIKGGAASVGLETIKTLAHSLEDIFKALFNEDLEIDAEVENLILLAYDCLRLPLMEQLTTGQFDSEQAMANAEPVFAQIEAQLGEFLRGAANNMPSSVDLGVDIALSIFEVDVAQGIDRLKSVLADPQAFEVAGELRAQAEIFAGLAELLSFPGFGAIASLAISAIEAHPDQALQVTQVALADFIAARQAVIDGDRIQGGTPSEALIKLANSADVVTAGNNLFETVGTIDELLPLQVIPENNIFSNAFASEDVSAISGLDDIFGDALNFEPASLEPLTAVTPITSGSQELKPIEQENIQSVPDLATTNNVSLDDLFGDTLNVEPASLDSNPAVTAIPEALPQKQTSIASSEQFPAIQDAANLADNSGAIVPAPINIPTVAEKAGISAAPNRSTAQKLETTPVQAAAAANLSVRVDVERLERMNNLVGELSINRNGLSLQNTQLQNTVQELLRRFAKFQQMGTQLRALSDQMLVSPDRYAPKGKSNNRTKKLSPSNDTSFGTTSAKTTLFSNADFDSLELDSYGELHSLLQGTLEEIVQLEETVGDVVLFAGQSTETLEAQRQMLGHLRDDLMWARMLPLGEVLNRFPRMLRDLSRSYDKPVDLKLSGTGVLVDKAALEKLYDPLLHLVRNSFDHGIEMPDVRRQQGKPEQGRIEIRAYHQGSQTTIEVRDDGRGLNLERIRTKATEMGLASAEQLATASTSGILELIFEPGFSTASQISELSGRGVGLDVVRSQLRSLKGDVTVSSEPGEGTVFTLRIPLTLTVAKLLVGFVGSTAFALPSDTIEEILIPQPNQVKQSGGQRFLHWQDRIIPAYHLSELLNYGCPVPETVISEALDVIASPDDWASPMLLLSQDDNFLALEIDRLVTEQELVIKPFGSAIAPPGYIYGCTILGDGSLIPVIDGSGLLSSFVGETKTGIAVSKPNLLEGVNDEDLFNSSNTPTVQTIKTPTVLVVDDSITLRQTLVLTFQKAGYRVVQAKDGREAIEQLQKVSAIQLVVCDVEMPNMNGFEFLSHRRQDSTISKIPVVMLTSRSSDKHRQLAMHLGANAYFTKPYIEQEFVAAAKTMIAQNALVGMPALTH
ncbi:MAG: hybrid sensor histidine kinase/response regulator [Gloeocapsa sp. UFS-A4-WI-NPMV-4B04]|jgi:chemotaxis family two-component system sensor histidine kinase/response regulator PixL|nr:hybrid sensor histidine kinase/response regulator [Gloeocapsa sp. UFS-A4-WI-NPMV-4B04]